MIRIQVLPSGVRLNQGTFFSNRTECAGFHLGLSARSSQCGYYPLAAPLVCSSASRRLCCWQVFNTNAKHFGPSGHLFRTVRAAAHGTALETGLSNKYEGEESKRESTEAGKFWAAVGLIIGTAVGPGILGLPAITIGAGTLPSSLTILASWVYVISSILLVAELTYAVMEEQGVEEVSFTGLAMHTLGRNMGIIVAIVYAMLNYALLVACIAGLGSLVQQQWPFLSTFWACVLFPGMVGGIVVLASFKVIDGINRILCVFMAVSVSVLVGVGILVGRTCIWDSFNRAVWNPSVVLSAVPVTVLTLGFHVITPFICKVVGKRPYDACKAVLCGGALPLAMVLSWNAVVLGLAGSSASSTALDPMKVLLSVSSSALPAVQAFAFSALGTTLIGYALSFPKQLADTLHVIMNIGHKHSSISLKKSTNEGQQYQKLRTHNGDGRWAHVVYAENGSGHCEEAYFDNSPVDALGSCRVGCLGQEEIGLQDAANNGAQAKVSAKEGLKYAHYGGDTQNFSDGCTQENEGNLSWNTSVMSKRGKMPISGMRNYSFGRKEDPSLTQIVKVPKPSHSKTGNLLMMGLIFGPPILIATLFPTAFAAALDFAGVYANCFLFGILPPLMAWNHRYKNMNRWNKRVYLLPGGQGPLILLLAISIILGLRLRI